VTASNTKENHKMTTVLTKPITEPAPPLPHRKSTIEPSLAESWTEAERTVAARKQEQAATTARAEAEARDSAEAERVRFAHD
jgi:hypothetical protein